MTNKRGISNIEYRTRNAEVKTEGGGKKAENVGRRTPGPL